MRNETDRTDWLSRFLHVPLIPLHTSSSKAVDKRQYSDIELTRRNPSLSSWEWVGSSAVVRRMRGQMRRLSSSTQILLIMEYYLEKVLFRSNLCNH